MRRRNEVGLGLGSIALLALLIGFASWLRDRRLLEQIFGEWSTEQVDRLSNGVYHLSITRPKISWGRRRVRVDSIALTTDSAKYIGNPDSLPRLNLVFRNCQLTGVKLVRLAFARGLSAHRFGCDVVDIVAEMRPFPTRARPDSQKVQQQFMVIASGLQLPERVPNIQITGVMFPHTRLALKQRRYSGARVALSLLLDWRLKGTNIDPRDAAAMFRPLFSEDVKVQADSVRFRPEPNIETRIGHIVVSVNDSTLELRDFAYGPTISDDQRAKKVRYRSDRIRGSAARVAYAGLDLTLLTVGNGLRMRKLEVDSATLDVLSDKGLPSRPQWKREARLTPQQWVAELDRGVEIDTVVVRDGHLVYRELHPDALTPGVLTFDGINAVATEVHHQPGRKGTSHPMAIRLTTRLMDDAALQAVFAVPLDAPDFAMNIDGHVGPMDVTALNRFVSQVTPVEIKSGRLDSVRFEIAVRNGIARGTVVPHYGDLSLNVTGQGSAGILGKKNLVGQFARAVAEVAVNQFGLRRSNPDGDKKLRAGRVEHPFTTDETLPAFLWNGIRDGLLEVVKKGGVEQRSTIGAN